MAKPKAGISGKTYELTIERQPGYLHARITAAEIDRRLALEYFSEIVVECRRTNADKLLIERNIGAMIPDDQLFDTMKDFVQMSLGIRIAFVNTNIAIEDAMRHIIFYGAGIGGQFRYFDNKGGAERWLESEK